MRGPEPVRDGLAPRREVAMFGGEGGGVVVRAAGGRGAAGAGGSVQGEDGLSPSALEAKLRGLCVCLCVHVRLCVCAQRVCPRPCVCVCVRVRAPGAAPHVGLTRQPRPDPGL